MHTFVAQSARQLRVIQFACARPPCKLVIEYNIHTHILYVHIRNEDDTFIHHIYMLLWCCRLIAWVVPNAHPQEGASMWNARQSQLTPGHNTPPLCRRRRECKVPFNVDAVCNAYKLCAEENYLQSPNTRSNTITTNYPAIKERAREIQTRQTTATTLSHPSWLYVLMYIVYSRRIHVRILY